MAETKAQQSNSDTPSTEIPADAKPLLGEGFTYVWFDTNNGTPILACRKAFSLTADGWRSLPTLEHETFT